MKRIEPKRHAKGQRGRPMKHGGYSLMIRRGELPERLTHIRRYLTAVRAGLVQDIAGQEENLTTAQLVLVDRAISLLSVLRTIESSLSEEGIMRGQVLAKILQENYITYTNSLRLILRELGIDKRQTSDVLDLGKYIEQKDREAKVKAGKAEKQAHAVQGVGDKPVTEGKDAQVLPGGQGGNGSDGQSKGSLDVKIEAPASTSSDIQGPEEVKS